MKVYQGPTSSVWDEGRYIRKKDMVLDVDQAASEIFFSSYIDHPNVVESADVKVFPERQNVFYSMTMPKGVPLHQTTLTMEETAKVFWDVACALQALREEGLVHGDVKPANIVVFAVDEDGVESDDMKNRVGLVGKIIDLGQIHSYLIEDTKTGTLGYYDERMKLLPDQSDMYALLLSAMKMFSKAYGSIVAQWAADLNRVPHATYDLSEMAQQAAKIKTIYDDLAFRMEHISSAEHPDMYEDFKNIMEDLYDGELECPMEIGRTAHKAAEIVSASTPWYDRKHPMTRLYHSFGDYEPLQQLWTLYCQDGKRLNLPCAMTKLLKLRDEARLNPDRAEEFSRMYETRKEQIENDKDIYKVPARSWLDWVYDFLKGKYPDQEIQMNSPYFFEELSHFN